MGTEVMLKDVRMTFNGLFEASAFQGKGEPTFSCNLALVPGSENDKAIRTAIEEECKATFGKDADKKMKSLSKDKTTMCYRSAEDRGIELEGIPGDTMILAARNKARPAVFDQGGTPTTAADKEVYSGCYLNAKVEIWVQSGDNEGIRCTIMGARKKRNGEPLTANRVASASDFEFDDYDEDEEVTL